MKRKIITILLFIAFSAVCTLYGMSLILAFSHTVPTGSRSITRVSTITVMHQYFIIPIFIGVLGWLATVYEILTLKESETIKTLRKKMSREGYDKSVYRIFSARGGASRLAILQSLDSPKLRGEIARMTGSDWKEVDRNVKILELANLVKIHYSHGSVLVYTLTENGKRLLYIMRSQKNIGPSKASPG